MTDSTSPDYLVASFRFFRGFHGRISTHSSEGAVEWPPSPWRLVCALLSAANPQSKDDIPQILRYLCSLPPPLIQTPPITKVVPEPKHSIPLDGFPFKDPFRESNEARQKFVKFRQDWRLEAGDEMTIRYCWPLTDQMRDQSQSYLQELDELMSLVPYLGSSDDSGIGLFKIESAHDFTQNTLSETWYPSVGTHGLPYVDERCLDDLVDFHLMGNPQNARFALVSPPRSAYSRSNKESWIQALFNLVDHENHFYAFPQTHSPILAENIRARVFQAAHDCGITTDFIHGHHLPNRTHLQIIPLPSIGHRHVDGKIRRVLLCGNLLADERPLVEKVFRALNYSPLTDNSPVSLLASAPDSVVCSYLQASDEWTTLTPVILPHHELRGREKYLWQDRHKLTPSQKNLLNTKLIRRRHDIVLRMFIDINLRPIKLIVQNEPFTSLSFRPSQYKIAEERTRKYMDTTRCHILVQFENPVQGPLTLGKGRFFGLGLFAPLRVLS